MGLIFNLLAAGIAYKVIKKVVSDDEDETTGVEEDTEEENSKNDKNVFVAKYQSFYKKNDNVYSEDNELVYNLVRDDVYKVVKVYNKQGFEIAVVKNKAKYSEIYSDYVLIGNIRCYTDDNGIYFTNTLNRLRMYYLSDRHQLAFINEFYRVVGLVDIAEDQYTISLEHKSYEKDAVLGIIAFEQIKLPKLKKKEEKPKNTSSHTSSSSSDDYEELYKFFGKKEEEPKTKESKKSSFFGGFVRFSDNYDYDYDRYRDNDDDKYDRNDKYDYHDNDDDDDDDDDYDYPDFDDNDD